MCNVVNDNKKCKKWLKRSDINGLRDKHFLTILSTKQILCAKFYIIKYYKYIYSTLTII